MCTVQIPDIKKLLANSRAEVFILINTSADGEVDNAVQNFASTFETAYCFEPIAIKVHLAPCLFRSSLQQHALLLNLLQLRVSL